MRPWPGTLALTLAAKVLGVGGFLLAKRIGVPVSIPTDDDVWDMIAFWPISLPLVSVVEEAIFRLPLVFVPTRWRWPAGVFSSVLFGWRHGAWGNVLVQGPVGVLLCTIFLRAITLDPHRSFLHPVVAHTLGNAIAIVVFVASFVRRHGWSALKARLADAFFS